MVIQNVDSAGAPAFGFVPRGQQQAETSGEETGNESAGGTTSNPGTETDLSLEQRVRGAKKLEVSRDGRELVNLNMLSSDLEFVSDQSNSSGLKAVMITRSEENPSDFQVSLLRVRPDGSTRTLFQTDNIELFQNQDTGADFDFRGALLDQRV